MGDDPEHFRDMYHKLSEYVETNLDRRAGVTTRHHALADQGGDTQTEQREVGEHSSHGIHALAPLPLPDEPTADDIDLGPEPIGIPAFGCGGQRRTGSHHGRGGRPKGATIRRRASCETHVHGSLAKTLLSGPMPLEAFVEGLRGEHSSAGSSAEILTDLLDLAKRDGDRCRPIPGCLLGVATVFHGAGVPADASQDVGEAPVICTWMDDDGHLRCSCLGEARLRHTHDADGFSENYCAHTAFFRTFCIRLGSASWTSFSDYFFCAIPPATNRSSPETHFS